MKFLIYFYLLRYINKFLSHLVIHPHKTQYLLFLSALTLLNLGIHFTYRLQIQNYYFE